MKIEDIKVGQNYDAIKEQVLATENIVISVLPSYISMEYLSIKNIETDEKIYVRVDDTGHIDSIKFIIDDVTSLKRITEENAREILAEALKKPYVDEEP